MGMFDTIHFDKAYSCPHCAAEIASTQTKAFDQSLSVYHVKDCVSHAEEIRIIKEELFCEKCSRFSGKYVYIAVQRGILVGVADTLSVAQSMLNDMNLEKLILWYHDLFDKFLDEEREKSNVVGFMENTVEWFEKGYHKIGAGDIAAKRELFFITKKEYLENAQEPLEAIKNYLAHRETKDEDRGVSGQ